MTTRTTRRLLIAALLGLAFGAARPATAGLIGSTVNVSAYYPGTTNVYVDPGNAVVSTSVEYAVGSYDGYSSYLQADITNNQLILSLTPEGGLTFSPAAFNGLILKVLSGPTILSATLDSASQFSPVSITLLNGNEVQLNYSGVTISSQGVSKSVINFTFAPNAVPEPSSLISGGIAGALCLAYVRRRKARRGA